MENLNPVNTFIECSLKPIKNEVGKKVNPTIFGALLEVSSAQDQTSFMQSDW